MMERGPTNNTSEACRKIGILFGSGLVAFLAALAIGQELGVSGQRLIAVLSGGLILAYVAIAFEMRATTGSDFFVADRAIPGFFNGLALTGAWMSVAVLISAPGLGFRLGFDATAVLIGWCAGFAVAGMVVAPYLRRSGVDTLAGFFRARYGAATAVVAGTIALGAMLLLLVVQLDVLGTIAARTFELPFAAAVAAASGLIGVLCLFGGMRSLTVTQAVQAGIAIIAFLLPLTIYALKHHGLALPQLSYGAVLPEIADLEVRLIEKGLADPVSMKRHVSPFFQLDRLNYFGVLVSVLAATVAMPHFAMRYGAAATAQEARYTTAWAAFFALVIVTAISAYAVFAKLEIYRLIDAAVPAGQFLQWFQSVSGIGLVDTHGVSLGLFESVVKAVGRGSETDLAIGMALAEAPSNYLAQWNALSSEARSSMVEVARGTTTPDWNNFATKLLPKLASGQGLGDGPLSHSSIRVHPEGVLAIVAERSGMSHVPKALVIAGLMSGLVAAASAMSLAAANTLSRDICGHSPNRGATGVKQLLAARLAVLIVVALAAVLTALCRHDLSELIMLAFSLVAASLFPPLVLGIWWRRVTASGAFAGITAGLGICLYYHIATRYFPVSFYETWQSVAIIGFDDADTYDSLRASWVTATGPEKAALWARLEAHVGANGEANGMANWFGLGPTAVTALFAIPANVLFILLMSVRRSRHDPMVETFIDGMRQPADRPLAETSRM